MQKRLTWLAVIAMGVVSLTLLSGSIAEACKKCNKAQTQECKIGKLKKTAKVLWTHKEHLQLTDDQLGKLKKIKHAAIKDIIRLNADIDVTKVDLDSAMWSEQIDTGKVNPLIDSKYAAKSNIAKIYVKALSDMQSVLDDEQRGKWLEIRTCQKMSKDCGSQCGGACDACKAKSKCAKCVKAGGTCAKCSQSKSGFCPITGKPLTKDKGSMKGSM
ncbi:MAG: Spy/CpxP family protein refolding chaperone [Candidatus Omnitrophica bacterium]|nr:Spy/CpxP family protein refolding chaperone [Candidatus Omnitrophota bacterium]